MDTPAIVTAIMRELGVRTADSGATLRPGLNVLDNRTGRPEQLSKSDSHRSSGLSAAELRAALDGMTLLLRDPLGHTVAGQLATAGSRGRAR